MSAELLLGRPCAECIAERIFPILDGKATLVTVGFDNPQWEQYTRSLVRSAPKFGAKCERICVDEGISFEELKRISLDLNANVNVAGIIVQKPLPQRFERATEFIATDKDVDCLSPYSLAKLYQGAEGFRPATPLAVLRLLDHYGVDIGGKHVVIVGRGSVGKPLALMALARNATVTICHSKTRNLSDICRTADVLISACGVADLIDKDCVTQRSVVVDVGLSFVEGRSRGDVASEVYDICSAVSPVPGGVGPVTGAALFENLAKAFIGR